MSQCGKTFNNVAVFKCVCVCVGKSQVMGEIKIALKKEVKTEGDHLVLEILQCRNITYKFKSPDHLPGNCRFTSSCYCSPAATWSVSPVYEVERQVFSEGFYSLESCFLVFLCLSKVKKRHNVK